MMVRDRQRNGNLAIVLLAELTAILPRHANRVLTLLRKVCVVDDKGFTNMETEELSHHEQVLGPGADPDHGR